MDLPPGAPSRPGGCLPDRAGTGGGRGRRVPRLEDLRRLSESRGGMRLQVKDRLPGLPFFRVSLSKAIVGELGYCSAYIFFSRLHLDAVEVFDERNSPRSGGLGLGLGLSATLGCAACIVGKDRGCETARLLAIRDDERTHARLVRYYTTLGFRVVREVEGGRLVDVPDMLVWGGAGTLMEGNIEEILSRWSPFFMRYNDDNVGRASSK